MSFKFLDRMPPRKRGIIYLLLSSFSFACMALFISLAGDMPVFQKAFFRNLVAIFMSYFILARSPEKFRIKKGSMPGLLMRASFGTIGILGNFYAISHTNMSDAMMLNKLSPFFAILTSIIVLKEAADSFQWAAILTALIGAIFVVKPSFLFGNLGVSGDDFFPLLVALIGGISAGIAYTFLRKVTLNGERPIIVVAFFSTFSCIALIPFIIFTYQPITLQQLFFCCMTGVSACFGQIFISSAYAACPAKEISIYDYSTVIFTALLGLIFLGEVPDWLSILGYAIIIGASVMNYMYNNGHLRFKKS
ncbi:DMT family transporter [Butyrivibrio sp. AE2032]|uniref:DMT family transporter n=1 Tax=Butyrivibrio sp. AE2032 TaxID=1458463 RepID=UPI0009DDD989|nr:DMT family transporter [Butyrivibrio sp. AE2032]